MSCTAFGPGSSSQLAGAPHPGQKGKVMMREVAQRYEGKLGEIERAMRELVDQNRSLKVRANPANPAILKKIPEVNPEVKSANVEQKGIAALGWASEFDS